MNTILPENEVMEFEDRLYIDPNVSLAEQNQFVDNLRNVQNSNNAEINAQTYNLGTAVPSNLGGLVGGEGYFTSRYQTPQNVSVAANLRTAAQAQALNEVLSNELAAQKKRYNDAYRAAQRRANTPTPTNPADDNLDPDFETTTPQGTGGASVAGLPGSYTVVSPDGRLHVVDMNTGDEESIAPGQKSKTRQQAAAGVGGGGEIRTLPNGNRVLIKPGYSLTKEGDKYYLVNKSNGNRTQVGG